MPDRASLVEFTSIPTASAREHRVASWIERWASARPDIALTRDGAGNITLAIDPRAHPFADGPPIYFTGHIDHPAMVVERIVAPSVLDCSLRGGVAPGYLERARVLVHTEAGEPIPGVITEKLESAPAPFPRYLIELEDDHTSANTDAPTDAIAPGDIVAWALPASAIEHDDGLELLRTKACDDLAAVHAALEAFDRIREKRAAAQPVRDTRILLTLAEEVGFIGAIGACRLGTIHPGARVIALECSRASIDAPLGAGPIVRVGDRLSVFSPALTAAVAKRAEEIAGAPPPSASQKLADAPAWKWQRKLMSGGACEASVFCAFGHEATCVCLPLGNYHNMGDLDAVQAETNTKPPTLAREEIALADYDNLVDLLEACAINLPEAGGLRDRIDKLWQERAHILTA